MHYSLRTDHDRRTPPFTWIALSICFLLFMAAAARGAVPEDGGDTTPAADETRSVREAAMTAYEKEDYDTAVGLLEDARALDPEDAEVAGRLGFAAKETGDYELALKTLESAVALRPDDYYYWWWLSDTQRLLGRYTDALKSMERARDLAPVESQEELQGYVAYTTILAGDAPSWENFDQHLHFAERHRKLRRTRRQIEEYVNALDVAPEFEPDDQKALGRLGWTYQQIGIQYLYIEEPDPAIDYLKQAIVYTHQAEAKQEHMRQEQFLAIAWQLKAEREPAESTGHYETAVKHWNRALDAAREVEDLTYQRYVQGRLLNALCRFRSLDDPELTALRKVNLKEVPWQGPVNEYSTADAVYGESRCRLLEGDYAGARILLEMALPYFEESQYLSDYQRSAELYLDLAWVYFRQEHLNQSLEMAAKADAKIEEARTYMDADTFNRSAARRSQRRATTARARARIAQAEEREAFTILEAYHTLNFRNLLGAMLVDDTQRTDADSETSVILRRITMLESHLADARETGNIEETARLEQRLVADKARLRWLERGLTFISPESLRFESLPPAGIEETQEALGESALLVCTLFDDRGGVAICVARDTIKGVLLEPNETDVYPVAQVFRETDDSTVLAAETAILNTRLFAPLLPLPEGDTLLVMTDGALVGAPFEQLGDGRPWASIAFTHTASRLVAATASPQAATTHLRYVVGRPDMDDAPCNATGPLGAACCIDGEALTVPMIVSDVQKEEAMHLGCILRQHTPDALLSELVFGDTATDNALPVARLLGMKLPAPVIVVDWVPSSGNATLHGDVITVTAGLLQYAGADAVLVVAPRVRPETRTLFFTSFYENLQTVGIGKAAQATRQILKANVTSAGNAGDFMLFGGCR